MFALLIPTRFSWSDAKAGKNNPPPSPDSCEKSFFTSKSTEHKTVNVWLFRFAQTHKNSRICKRTFTYEQLLRNFQTCKTFSLCTFCRTSKVILNEKLSRELEFDWLWKWFGELFLPFFHQLNIYSKTFANNSRSSRSIKGQSFRRLNETRTENFFPANFTQ